MAYSRVIKSSLLALIPVLVALAIWIIFRGEKLEQLSRDLNLEVMVPNNNFEAIRIWSLIWIVISVVLSFLCGGIYFWLTQKWHWKALYYAIFVTGVAVLISILAYAAGIIVLRAASGEILIAAIGFGVFIPWFAQRNLRDYS
jgi:hypothetical protein